MKWKNRLTNYNFWVSIASAILLILQNFDVQLDIANFNDILTAILGLFVVLGIINDPTKSSSDSSKKQEQVVKEDDKDENNTEQSDLNLDIKNEVEDTNKEANEDEEKQSTEPLQSSEADEILQINKDAENNQNLIAEKKEINALTKCNNVMPINTKDEDAVNFVAPVEEVFVEDSCFKTETNCNLTVEDADINNTIQNQLNVDEQNKNVDINYNMVNDNINIADENNTTLNCEDCGVEHELPTTSFNIVN